MTRKILKILSLVIIGILFATHTATAAGWNPFSLDNIAISAVNGTAKIFTAIVASLASVFIMFCAYLVNLALELNASGNIVNSPTVQVGFSVSLAFVNLIYVIAIIVIAIATIMRNNTYGAKQTLVRLLISAVLVNFGLVIAGVMIRFSDQLMKFFLDQINPSGNFLDFTSRLADALTINKLQVTSKASLDSMVEADAAAGLTGLINIIVGPLMAIAMGIIIGAILLAIAVMLIVRYVYMVFLLIIMPFSYIAWVLPRAATKSDQGYLTSWWSKFNQWLLFGPVVLFFVYLALLVRFGQGDYLKRMVDAANNPNGPAQALLKVSESIKSDFLTNMMENVVLVSLLMGGLVVAKSMGMHGAGAADKVVKSIGSKAKTKAANIGRKTALATAQKTGAAKIPERLARIDSFRTAKEQMAKGNKIRGLAAYAGGAIAKVTGIESGIRAAGRSLEDTQASAGKKMVSAAAKEIDARSWRQVVNDLQGYGTVGDMEKIIAALAKLQKEGKLGEIKSVGGMDLTKFTSKYKDTFERYGQGKLLADIKDETGISFVEHNRNYELAMAGKDSSGETIKDKAVLEKTRAEAEKKLKEYYTKMRRETAEKLVRVWTADLDKLTKDNIFEIDENEIARLKEAGEIAEGLTGDAARRAYYNQLRTKFFKGVVGTAEVGKDKVNFHPEVISHMFKTMANEGLDDRFEEEIAGRLGVVDFEDMNSGAQKFFRKNAGNILIDMGKFGKIESVDKDGNEKIIRSEALAKYQQSKMGGKKEDESGDQPTSGSQSTGGQAEEIPSPS